MRERFRPSDIRFLVICAVVLAATVWFAARFFYQAFPEASIDFRVNRGGARKLAEGFLTALGHQIGGYREASRFSFDDEAKIFLERELGLARANQIMGSRVRLWRWSHRWFRPQQKEEYRVDITPHGETAGFEHEIPEAESRPSLPAAQARSLAEAFLREKMTRDPATLDFVEGSSVTRPARTDHTFTWKERDFNIKDATYRFEVSVLGNEVGGYHEYLKVPEAWLRDYERLRSRNQAAQTIDTAVMLLLVIGLLVTLLVRVRSHDVRWRRAGVVGSLGAVLFLLSSWNSQPLAEFGYPTTDSYVSFLSRQFLQHLLSALAGGGLLFTLTAAAEPLYRECYGFRVSLGNLFRPRGLRTRSFFLGAVLGLTLTGIFVAYQTAFYLLAYRWGAWSPADVSYDDLLNTHFPWLYVLLGGYLPAISEEFLFRMFSIPFLTKLLRSTWIAVVLAGFIWGFGHAGYPQQPFYIRGVEVGIGGVALGLVMLRWGILPTLVWHYSVDALYAALLLLRSHNLYFMFSGAASAGIMVLPVVIAWIAYLRGGGFEPESRLTNAAEGFSPPVEEKQAPVEAAAVLPYEPWGTRRRLAALAILIAAVAFLLVHVQKWGESPGFALSASQARSAASEFIQGLGLNTSGFRDLEVPRSPWEGDQAEVAKYFLERRPISYLAETARSNLPFYDWGVRFYKPLDKEEFRVGVHPETGRVFRFEHVLPEDRPGADLAPEAAQKIAAGLLSSRGFDLNTLELKETSSEKKKARRDHTLVWEAKPGDLRNLDETHYRVRVEVAGDRVVSLYPYWKLPETFLRDRSRRNALSNILLFLRVAFMAGAVVWGLWLLIQRTRKRELRWRSAVKIALPLAALGILGALATTPLMFRAYDTAIPLETFKVVMITGVVISAIGLGLGLAGGSGLLLALRPDGAASLRTENRRVLGLDALLAAVLAAGLASFVVHLRTWLINQFHAQALISVDGPTQFASVVPSVSVIGSACQTSLYALVLLALAAHVVRGLRSRWTVLALAFLAVAAFVPTGAHTVAEFLLYYGLALLTGGILLAYCAWFARTNYLAYVLAAWILAIRGSALDLWSQPNAALQHQAWLLVACVAAALVWAIAPAFKAQID